MKVVFETNAVLPKLSQVVSVINSKNAMQILGSVVMSVSDDSIVLTASDGDVWVTEKAPIIKSDGTATFCVSSQDITKCLRTLVDETVTFSFDEDTKLLTCSYGNGKMSMPYEDASLYPRPSVDMNDCYEVIMHSSVLRDAIDATQTAIANDELRPIMNGIHFDFTGNTMTCNACNFLKMVKYRRTLNTMENERCFFTLPKKPSALLLSVLADVDEDVKLAFNEKSVSVSNRNFKVTARMIDGNYPNCDMIIPKDTPVQVEVGRDELVQALRRVMSVDNESSLVSFVVDAYSITLSEEDLNLNKEATERIECVNSTGESFSICFNGLVLTELLKNINDEKVVFEMCLPSKPAIIYAKDSYSKDEYLSLIMPMIKNITAPAQSQ